MFYLHLITSSETKLIGILNLQFEIFDYISLQFPVCASTCPQNCNQGRGRSYARKKEKSSSPGLSVMTHCKLMAKTKQAEASKCSSSSRPGACL